VIGCIRIENWVIVEEALLELGPGLNVLTGETGTGKSIVLGALSLLAGGRGSADAIRTGCDAANLEAVFETAAWPELEQELARRALPVEGHELIVQRTVSRAGGRSRVRVGGELLPASALAELLADRIEISSQHSSQTLLRPDVQMRLLDESGGLSGLRDQVDAGVSQLRALDRELAELQARAEERARREDFLAFQIREIDELGLRPGEIAEIEATHASLAHADRLQADGRAACSALVGDPDGGGDERPSAVDRAGEALRLLDGLASVDLALESLAVRLRDQETELFEIGRELERYLQRIDADPGRLAQVEERIAALQAVQRKYGRSEEEIDAFRAQALAQLDAAHGADVRIGELEGQRAAGRLALVDVCEKLGAGRRKSAGALARAVEECLAALAMPGARFEVAVEAVAPQGDLPCGSGGAERVEFRFSANRGEPLRALRLAASGGELSRVFLAVRNALRRSGAGMVLVFDEVDAGIGGRVAESVGRALSELAHHHQVLCITHLPQIAAFGDVHFRVSKHVSQHGRRGKGRSGRGREVTLARVERIEGDARVEEIARMAGGEAITDATRRHAAELLAARPVPAVRQPLSRTP
jgi:DNA repair protein RecN (Recombination protein N)